jgi:hypothetical protein
VILETLGGNGVDKIEVNQYFLHGLIEQTWIQHIFNDVIIIIIIDSIITISTIIINVTFTTVFITTTVIVITIIIIIYILSLRSLIFMISDWVSFLAYPNFYLD